MEGECEKTRRGVRITDILFVSEFFYPRAAGGEIWSWELCKALAKEHNVTVLTLRHDDASRAETVDGVQIFRPYDAGKGRLGRRLAAGNLKKSVKGYLTRNTPDVIHVMAYAMNMSISRLAKRQNIPCVTAVHSYFGKSWKKLSKISPLLREYEKRALLKDKSHVMHVPSTYLKERIQRDLGKRCAVVHNWVTALPKAPKRTDEYLFVGSLEPVKNPLACLDVTKKLVVIGTGSLRKKMEKEAAKKGVQCEFHDHLSRKETLQRIGSAKLVLIPSVTESFSLVALEAVAQGTPVAGNMVGILPELPGVVSFPPKNIPTLTKQQVADVKKKFTIEKAVQGILACYEKAINM
ncbi:MAG: glycosyltransferase family 4 protein [Candidatus Woesearchaeota archaeon]|nr:glycosyltransferase family 4 protein [Candidatus Woesearchaeota archaeon]